MTNKINWYCIAIYVLHKIGSISALVWDTIMKQVAPGSLFNKVYFDLKIMHNRQANLPLAPTVERIKCTRSLYVQTQKTVFVQLLEKLSLLPSHSSTSFPWCWLVNVQRFEAVFVDTGCLKAASVDTAHLRAFFDPRNSVSMRSVTREFLLESAHLISLLSNVHLTLRKLVDEDTIHLLV